MIYTQGKPQSGITTGLEDIPTGRNCFDLERIKITPVEPTANERKAQRNRENSLARYYKNISKNTDHGAFLGQTYNFTQIPTPSKTMHFATGRNASI